MVSGLARIIESAAREASMVGSTVAIFANSIDLIYPTENEKLVHPIVDRAVRLSQKRRLPGDHRRSFPRRNRIVAGMALGLVVVEAAKRSGSLISARFADEMGRDVFVFPGSPLDPCSAGGNHLIKHGAMLITSASDILEAIDPLSKLQRETTYLLEERDSSEYSDEPQVSRIATNCCLHTVILQPKSKSWGGSPTSRR
ncbi:MAG: DNA-processing protein DprA [Rhizobiaceae bacterium]